MNMVPIRKLNSGSVGLPLVGLVAVTFSVVLYISFRFLIRENRAGDEIFREVTFAEVGACSSPLRRSGLVFGTVPDEKQTNLTGCSNWRVCSGASEVALPEDVPQTQDGVYFLETSGNPFLSPKQMCSVEAAARHNPTRLIIAAISHEHLLSTPAVADLKRIHSNVHFVHLNATEWCRGTVLEAWMQARVLEDSPFPIIHTSDVLRWVTLWKYGGIYMDFDVITLQPLNVMKNNTVGFHSTKDEILSAVLAFEKGHPVLEMCLKETPKWFHSDTFWNIGSALLTSKLKAWCGNFATNWQNSTICKDVELLPPYKLYPVPWQDWKTLLDDDPTLSYKVLQKINSSLTLHWASHFSANQVTIYPNSKQALAWVARDTDTWLKETSEVDPTAIAHPTFFMAFS